MAVRHSFQHQSGIGAIDKFSWFAFIGVQTNETLFIGVNYTTREIICNILPESSELSMFLALMIWTEAKISRQKSCTDNTYVNEQSH